MNNFVLVIFESTIFIYFRSSLKISSNNCFVMVRCGLAGSNFGLPYNLLLITYNLKNEKTKFEMEMKYVYFQFNTLCLNHI